MRLSTALHGQHDFRIHGETRGCRLLDLWEYPVAGGPDDFPRFLEVHDLEAMVRETSPAVKLLFGMRLVLGRVFRWDSGGPPYQLMFDTEREQALWIENATVAAIMHLAWVERVDGTWTAWLAVYARPKGRLGRVYLEAIAPFRHRMVYPELMRVVRKRWQRMVGGRA